MAGFGLLFLLVVLVQPLVRDPGLSGILTVASYLLWAVFVAEILFRFWLTEDRRGFLRTNWWRFLVLAVPFLRWVPLLHAFRVTALAGLVGPALRGSHSALRLLSGRLAALTVVTGVVIMVATYVLYVLRAYHSYGEALHDVALATIAGQPMGSKSGIAQSVEVLLATYSVIVFAALAGSMGAYFLGDDRSSGGGSGARQDGSGG